MDFDEIQARLAVRAKNQIITFEKGEIVRRTHERVSRDIDAACRALEAWGIVPGARVGIRAPNSYGWVVWDLALIRCGAQSIAFTDDFASHSPRELCEKYQLSLLLLTSEERVRTGDLPFVVAIDGELGGPALPRAEGSIPADIARKHPWRIFSSGSADGLKGLVLARDGVQATIRAFAEAVVPRHDDCLLLFLPISNFQQRLMYYAALWYGFDLIVTEPARLFSALKELSPTILIAPPALYETIETRLHNAAGWKRTVASIAGPLAQMLPAPLGRALARAVFKDVRLIFGPKMRFMVTGMAPIKKSTLDLFARMHLPLFETYGLIECGSVALNVPGAHRIGSVGRVLPGVRVEIAVDGEIVVEKPHMTSVGYFECAAGEQERTYVGDNRVATGDIGRFDADGFLYLIGRKKEIIVTQGGEKVHPEVIEAEIDACSDVAKSVIIADEEGSRLIAVVHPRVPDDVAARRRIEAHVERVADRRAIVTIARVQFIEDAFTRENGLLRPNLKLDRKRIAAHVRAHHGDAPPETNHAA